MNPRRPIGMSESAKKRAARLLTRAAAQDIADLLPADDDPQFQFTQQDVLADVGADIYAKARALYRVGERLRPCPGCPGCLRCELCGQPAACYGKYDGMLRPEHHCDACCGHGNEDGWCDPIGAECGRCAVIRLASIWQISIGGDCIEVPCPACNDAWRVAICDGSGLLPARRRP